MRRVAILLLCIFLVAWPACTRVTYAFYAEPLAPEGWYQQAQQQMAHCLNLGGLPIVKRDFAEIEWLQTRPGAIGYRGLVPGTDSIAAQWNYPDRIYIDARFTHDIAVVRHELGHWITQLGDELHADTTFLLCTGAL